MSTKEKGAKSRVSTPKKKSKKSLGRRFKAIVLPPNGGKSLLVKSLHQSNSLNKTDNIFVDIDAMMVPNKNRNKDSKDIFQKVKTKLLKTYNDFRDFKVVLVTSNPDLVKFLKLDADVIFTYYPSTFLFIKMLAGKGLVQSNPRIRRSSWDKPPAVPKINSDGGSSVQPTNFSLSHETGLTQLGNPKLNGISEMDLGKLYDEEMEYLATTFDAFANKSGSKKYNDLKELLTLIANDLYKTKL